MNWNFNTSAVEEFLHNAISGVVSDNTTVSTLPHNIKQTWNDMVVIDCELPILDATAFAYTTVYIYLYARPHQDGTKNVRLMSELEKKLCDVIDNNTDSNYVLERLSSSARFDEKIKWHMSVIEVIVKIF